MKNTLLLICVGWFVYRYWSKQAYVKTDSVASILPPTVPVADPWYTQTGRPAPAATTGGYSPAPFLDDMPIVFIGKSVKAFLTADLYSYQTGAYVLTQPTGGIIGVGVAYIRYNNKLWFVVNRDGQQLMTDLNNVTLDS